MTAMATSAEVAQLRIDTEAALLRVLKASAEKGAVSAGLLKDVAEAYALVHNPSRS